MKKDFWDYVFLTVVTVYLSFPFSYLLWGSLKPLVCSYR
jgi:hypothetical protein